MGVLLVALVVCGCSKPDRAPSESVREKLARGQDTTSPKPTARPDERNKEARPAGRPVASVNDVSIERQELRDLLWESRGLAALQQLVFRAVARQEAERLGIEISAREIDREYDLTLQAARFDGLEPEELTPARREQLIEQWTRSRGITRQELAIAMERQAILRRIVAGQVEITEEMLQREFTRVHGEKAEVRHIQLAAPRVWQQLRVRLDKGEAFADLVSDYSQNRLSRRDGGLLPPFSADDPTVPAALAQAAFALELGQISNPIEVEGSYHVLKLLRRIPAEDVAFDDVKPRLRQTVFARRVGEARERLGETLLRRCRLRIEDRVLRRQYEARHAAGDLVGPALQGP